MGESVSEGERVGEGEGVSESVGVGVGAGEREGGRGAPPSSVLPGARVPWSPITGGALGRMFDSTIVLGRPKDARKSSRRCQEATALRGLSAATGP